MAVDPADRNLALFCDFENIALGVQDSNNSKLDIGIILERLLVKGNVVTKKAYCDWDRYKQYKPAMHDAAFELIEIPHTRQSGKNSADIRMVVDALDLCYTKDHIDTFVIISGDSDFSPLVSKLRENAKLVIGIGVKNSTSDLLTKNCDEFIYYDDLASHSRNIRRSGKASKKKSSGKKKAPKESSEMQRRDEGVELVVDTTEALIAERGNRVFGSMVKQTLKRRQPGFNESYYGFRSFGELLEEASRRGLLSMQADEKSGGYVVSAVSR